MSGHSGTTPLQRYVLRMESGQFEGLGDLAAVPDCRGRALAQDRIESMHELSAYRILRTCRDECRCPHASVALAHLYAAERADRLEQAEYGAGFDLVESAAVWLRKVSGMIDRLVQWAFKARKAARKAA